MCGVLPLVTRMLAGLQIGYVEVTTIGGLFGPGHVVRGHVFHHSALAGAEPDGRSYRMRRSGGDEVAEGYSSDNVLASYAHLHFASDPTLAPAFVERCLAFAGGRGRPAEAGARRRD
jgi:cobyrinic acid a,c-diamide synthase